MKRFIIISLLIIACTHKLYSQFSNIDNARVKVYTAATDKEKLNNLIAITKHRNSLPADSLYHYAQLIKQLAIKLKDKKSMAFGEYCLILGDLVKGKTDSIIYKIDKNEVFENVKKTDTFVYYKLQFLKANALNRLNKRTEALDLQFKILNEAENEGNVNSQLFALNFIGATYLNVENKGNEAKQTWLSALKIIEKKNNPQNKEIEVYILSNLALYYCNLFYVTPSPQLEDTSFHYFNTTIRLCKEIEAMGVMASMLSYRANLYAYKKMFVNAEADFKEVVSIRKKIGDPLYVSEDYVALAQFYFSIKEYSKCIEEVNEGLKVCKQGHILATELSLLGIEAEVYKANKVYDKYSATLEKIIVLSDSNNRMNSADKIADIQTKYDVKKKKHLLQNKNWIYYSVIFYCMVQEF